MPNIGKQRYQGLNEDFAVITGVTAAAADVLAGKIFVNAARATITGTMVDKAGVNTAATASLGSGATASSVLLTIPATGKYTTASTLSVTYGLLATLIGLTSADLVAGNSILGIGGSIVDKTGLATTAVATLDTGASKVVYTIPANAYYDTTATLTVSYADMATLIGLTAAKIVNGNTILGIAGA